jgi:hypothetical protein
MLHAIENFIIAEIQRASADLVAQDRARGGTWKLHDIALSLTQGRTVIAVHCDFHDDDRMLSSWFRLWQPLPAGMREPLCEFLLDLHGWLEGRQAAPKLPVSGPRVTLH